MDGKTLLEGHLEGALQLEGSLGTIGMYSSKQYMYLGTIGMYTLYSSMCTWLYCTGHRARFSAVLKTRLALKASS